MPAVHPEAVVLRPVIHGAWVRRGHRRNRWCRCALTAPTGNGLEGTFTAAQRAVCVLPGLPPGVVLLQQPLDLVANPTADGIQIKTAAALAGTTSRHAIDELAAGLNPGVQATISAVFHGLTLPTPTAQPTLPSQPDQGNRDATQFQRQQKHLHLRPPIRTAARSSDASAQRDADHSTCGRRRY